VHHRKYEVYNTAVLILCADVWRIPISRIWQIPAFCQVLLNEYDDDDDDVVLWVSGAFYWLNTSSSISSYYSIFASTASASEQSASYATAGFSIHSIGLINLRHWTKKATSNVTVIECSADSALPSILTQCNISNEWLYNSSWVTCSLQLHDTYNYCYCS